MSSSGLTGCAARSGASVRLARPALAGGASDPDVKVIGVRGGGAWLAHDARCFHASREGSTLARCLTDEPGAKLRRDKDELDAGVAVGHEGFDQRPVPRVVEANVGSFTGQPIPVELHELGEQHRVARRVTDIEADVGVATALVGEVLANSSA